MSEQVIKVEANPTDLARITTKMGDALIGEDKYEVVMACLAMSLFIQLPSITGEELIKGVEEVSKHVSLYLSTVNKPLTPSQVN